MLSDWCHDPELEYKCMRDICAFLSPSFFWSYHPAHRPGSLLGRVGASALSELPSAPGNSAWWIKTWCVLHSVSSDLALPASTTVRQILQSKENEEREGWGARIRGSYLKHAPPLHRSSKPSQGDTANPMSVCNLHPEFYLVPLAVTMTESL